MRKHFFTCLFSFPVFIAAAQPGVSPRLVPVIPDSNSVVYNGIEHVGYMASIEGIPYYSSLEWIKGTMVYRDQPYAGVDLKYDLIRDEVILRHFNGYVGVTLFTPRLQSFTLGDKKFVNLSNASGRSTGFYEELVTGTAGVYAKRSKKINETLLATGVERKISASNAYYILKDGVLHGVRNEKSVLELFKDHKSEIRAHLKGRGLKFRKNPEAYLLVVANHYNQLSR